MEQTLTNLRVNEALAKIRGTLADANQIAWRWESQLSDKEEKEQAEYLIEHAFVELLVLLEVLGLHEALGSVKLLQTEASKNYAATDVWEGELYFVWSSKLNPYLTAVQTTLGTPSIQIVTKDLVDILRNTLYAITDRACFESLPSNETAVHARIEAVLRCIFPDLLTKPPIQKPIKNFHADTGIPSTKTLIEYKYVGNENDVKRIVDEVLADTRGYHSPDWNKFIYVIYETSRIKSERQWKELLQKSGVGNDTDIIVLPGESK